MTWVKAHWKGLTAVLLLLLGAAWYSRPVDIYGLGMGELEAISVQVMHNIPGQGVDIVWSAAAVPDDSPWQPVLEEVEHLRFHRTPDSLIRQFWPSDVIKTKPADRTELYVSLRDQEGREMFLLIGGSRSHYNLENRSFSLFFSGGEDAVQALAGRLQEI